MAIRHPVSLEASHPSRVFLKQLAAADIALGGIKPLMPQLPLDGVAWCVVGGCGCGKACPKAMTRKSRRRCCGFFGRGTAQHLSGYNGALHDHGHRLVADCVGGHVAVTVDGAKDGAGLNLRNSQPRPVRADRTGFCVSTIGNADHGPFAGLVRLCGTEVYGQSFRGFLDPSRGLFPRQNLETS